MGLKNQTKRLSPFLKARIASWFVDHVILIVLNSFISLLIFLFLNKHLPHWLDFSLYGAKVAWQLNLSILYLSYFFGANYFFQGRTFGQSLFKIGAINNKNFKSKEISAWCSIQRSTANLFCFKLYGLPFLIPFFNESKKSLADIISDTHQSYSFYKVPVKVHATTILENKKVA